MENLDKRRGILFSLFIDGKEYQEKVEQIVSVLLDITVSVDIDK